MQTAPEEGRGDNQVGNETVWTVDAVLEMARGYQGAAVLAAAADLEVFAALAAGPATAAELSTRLKCDARGMTVLLDALTALRLLEKSGARYRLAAGVDATLTPDGDRTVLAMAQHQANCLRNWAQLATVVKTGKPAPDIPSVRGEAGDQAAFIGAMHNVSAPMADEVIQAVQPLQFRQLLDIGGASGTWTAAFLRACPPGQAVLFDLPQVIPMARQRLTEGGLAGRVRLVAGDFYKDELPGGVDLAWLSAIVHQNSRAQNRELFGRIYRSLEPGGRLAIRDILMEQGRTRPTAGALFAVNMLVATEGGGTFTFDELREDLVVAGFEQVLLRRRDEGMNAVVVATRPRA